MIAFSWILLIMGIVSTAAGQQGCWDCHGDRVDRVTFESSVHQDLACTVCHRDVQSIPHEQPPMRLTAQACAGCHPDQVQQYQQSVHGQARAQGIGEAARCADCHSAHAIFSKTDPRSSVFVRNLPQTCGRCHENSGLSERFGLAAHRYSTYWESYHGLSVKYGNLIAAKCSSCHGSHLILAASDPKSSIHPSNLWQTCGQCHPTASANLLKGKVHVEAKLSVSPEVYAVHVFYLVFLGVFATLFVLHVSLDIIRWVRRRKKRHAQ
ncbi:MAG: cytochrome c3 family protein [Candidatus Bipolaricaulota bacterium]|nr:cytochrome c3 family protein [Candidatus Bipolaricaulota bacterium]